MTLLCVSHDATRTGAPILFLNLMRWLKKEGVQFEILLKRGGELENDFNQVQACRVYYGYGEKQPLFQRLKAASREFFGCMGIKGRSTSTFGQRGSHYHRLDIIKKYGRKKIDVVYNNTITNGDILPELALLGAPIITHVHELENFIYSCGKENLDRVIAHTSLYIAASNAVKDNLVDNHGIPEDKVRVVHEYTPVDVGPSVGSREMRQHLGIAKDAFVVGGAGTTDWRKSPDVFLQLARCVRDLRGCEDIYFLWVGGACLWELDYDIKKMGLKNIRFIPSNPTPLDFFNCFDALALTSRIDPYPLVCLESAALGKPIICFDKAGGMPEFVGTDCGFVVPYLDVLAMAERVDQLCTDRALCRHLGENAKNKVAARHDLDTTGRELLSIMKSVIANN